MRFSIFAILLANTLPILFGIIGYTALFEPFRSPYVPFTALFWSIASIIFALMCRNPASKIPEMLRNDLRQVGKQRFFLFIAIVMIAINIQWLAASRDMGLDNRGVVFKIFFIFEDLYFIVFAVALYRILTRRTLVNALSVLFLSYPMIAVFGRFGIIACAGMAFLLLTARHKFLSRTSLAGFSIILFFVFIGISHIENSRASEGVEMSGWSASLDRIGEFATLSLVDNVFLSGQYYGFVGFDNLAYVWAPSIFFPEKPIINDGASFLRFEYGLGSGENATRFPIMLHVDSFRRFGWWGLSLAILPAVIFRFMLWLSFVLQRKLGVPFLSLVAIKYSIFFYPKSVLGLIEIGSYTFLRSALILFVLTMVFKALLNQPSISRYS